MEGKNKKEIWAQPKLGLTHLRLKPVLPQPRSRLRFHKKELGLVIVWLSSFAIPNCG